MKQTYKIKSRRKGWMGAGLLALALAGGAFAQEGSQGNTTIFGGAQMTFFGNHNFLTGGAGTQPGVILTERATASISYLNFSGDNLTSTGVNDANYVDGYVRKYGAGQFIFPVGDNANAGQFAASADGTSGAYFHTDPSTAITSNLFTGAPYGTALPAGGPFLTTNKATTLGAVSTVEYWDIDGTVATKLALTWDAGSNIATLVGTLEKLTIAGWNPTLSQWVKIASTVDVTSVLGGASGLTAGSITTDAAIVPNTYTAYTLAALVPDLTPTVDIDDLSFSTEGAQKDFVVNLYEINNVIALSTTPGFIRFRVAKLSAFTITYPATSGTSNVFGGTANENSNWAFTENATFITVSAKAGVNIAPNGQAKIGFNIKRNVGSPPNNSQNITPTIIGTSGGEINSANNQAITTVTAN